MEKITLKYEQDLHGKKDFIQKEIDIDYQSGSAQNSPEMQTYSELNSITMAYLDFMNRVGYEPTSIFLHMEKTKNSLTEEEITEEDLAKPIGALDYAAFLKEFNNSEEFRQRQFELFQMYMSDEDED